MGIFRPSRTVRGVDPYFRHKVIIFAIGAPLGIAGMSSRRDWLVALAIAVLAVGVLLRVLSARQRARDSQPDEEQQPH